MFSHIYNFKTDIFWQPALRTLLYTYQIN